MKIKKKQRKLTKKVPYTNYFHQSDEEHSDSSNSKSSVPKQQSKLQMYLQQQ